MAASSPDLVTLILLILTAVIAYTFGKGKTKIVYLQVPRRGYKSPDLRQLIVKARFSVTDNAEDVEKKLKASLNPDSDNPQWLITKKGNVIEVHLLVGILRDSYDLMSPRKRDDPDSQAEYFAALDKIRAGIPKDVLMVGSENDGRLEFDVTVRPVLYFKVTQTHVLECTEQEIQEAQHECAMFASKLSGIIGGKEIEAPTARALALPSDVQRVLVALGMQSQANLLVEGEDKILSGNSPDGVKNCRSALEQVLQQLMTRKALDPTNSFKHNLERLVSKNYLNHTMKEAIYEFHYRLLCEDTHDKFSADPREGKYIMAVTQDTIDFLIDAVR